MKTLWIVLMSCFIVFLFAANIFAQGPDTLWTRTYGGNELDWGQSVQQTSDSGYIITGVTMSFGSGLADVYLIKTDSFGDTIWTKTYGGTNDDWGESVQQTSDGGYIITGVTTSFGSGWEDIYLIKTDAVGDTIWTKTYGGIDVDFGYSVQQTSDEEYIITGCTRSFGEGAYDVYLIKTDAVGDTIWTKTYGGTNSDYGLSVQQTSEGGYILVGLTRSFGGGGYDVYLIKTDSVGDTIWIKTYGGTDDDWGESVQQTSDGGYIITGATTSFGSGWEDIYLIKTDAVGDTIWTKTYGGIGWDEGLSGQETSDGGYILTGWTNSFGAGNFDVYLIKTDAAGETLWTITYGGDQSDEGCSIYETFDGGYVIVGFTNSFSSGGDNVYLIKTEADIGIKEQKEDLRYETTDISLICHPNPFSTSTTITLSLSSIGHRAESIELEVYDISGRLIKSIPLTTNHLSLGTDLNPGIYFLKLTTGQYIETKKIIKIR